MTAQRRDREMFKNEKARGRQEQREHVCARGEGWRSGAKAAERRTADAGAARGGPETQRTKGGMGR